MNWYELLIAAMLLVPPTHEKEPSEYYDEFIQQEQILRTYALMYPHRDWQPYIGYAEFGQAFWGYYSCDGVFDLQLQMYRRELVGDINFFNQKWPLPLTFSWE